MVMVVNKNAVVRVSSLDEFFTAEVCFPHRQIVPAPPVLDQLNQLSQPELEYKREEAKHFVALFRQAVDEA